MAMVKHTPEEIREIVTTEIVTEESFTLTLSREEAKIIRVLVGAVGGVSDERRIATALYEALGEFIPWGEIKPFYHRLNGALEFNRKDS